MGDALKIFGVGWPKTGTSTLRRCFVILGYTHKGYCEALFENLDQAVRVARKFDTFQDLPWYLYYKELDQIFPGSKFVLTIRDSAKWLKSYRNMLAKQDPQRKPVLDAVRRKIYDLPFPDVEDDHLIERYERHNFDVVTYFAGRSEDLLLVNWEEGDDWKPLCYFLGKTIPSRPFPHENKGDYS